MIDDFELIVHKFNDRKDRHIYLLGDVHLGAKECLEDEFAKFLQMVKSDDAGYLILLGDLLNNGVKSSVTNVYDEVLMPGNAKRQMIEYLEPVSDKILCAVTGNHERRTLREDDIDITYDIMSQLGIEERCRRNIAFLKLQFVIRVLREKQIRSTCLPVRTARAAEHSLEESLTVTSDLLMRLRA